MAELILTETERDHVYLEIDKLQATYEKTEDFGEKLDIKGKIHNMQMILNGVKPYGSIQYFCEGCGS